jgi:hypothetical protein
MEALAPSDLEILVPSPGKRRAKKAAKPEGAPKPAPPADPQKEIVKLIITLTHRYSSWQIFSDFVEMSAISLSNAADLGPRRDKREERYLQIVKQYRREDLDLFPQMFAHLVMALEEHPCDVLGKTYHELELHNKWAGQYFTPWDVCEFMAKMEVGDGCDLKDKLEARGFIRAAEPSCGSAALMVALALALKDAGVNYQRELHVTATDIDAKCVHMAFLQLSLMHIPAVVVHGNSLSLEEWDRWYTPAHILGGWDRKLYLDARREAEAATPAETPVETPVEEPIAEVPIAALPALMPPPPLVRPGTQMSLF